MSHCLLTHDSFLSRWNMELKAAQEAFVAMLHQMQQPDSRKAFLMWIDNTFIRAG